MDALYIAVQLSCSVRALRVSPIVLVHQSAWGGTRLADTRDFGQHGLHTIYRDISIIPGIHGMYTGIIEISL